jgi:hypothetical protein
MDQVSAALAGQSSVDAMHIISHGSDGTLYLGSTVLKRENLSSYSHQLAAIGAALSTEGDILLYGCDVAATVYGQQFIEALAHLTGADVAASTDATGSAALGGDLQLEATTGRIEAAALLTADIVDTWDQLLAVPAILGVASSAAYTEQAMAIVLSPALTVTDADGTLAGATVRVNGVQSGDVLAATVTGTSITAVYNAGNGMLVLSGNDTVAHYQQVLRSATFASTSDNPTNRGLNPTRAVDWQVNDGTALAGPLYGSQTTFGAGTGPSSVALADLNADGKPDLIVANSTSNNISVLLGNGNGTFVAATNFAAGFAPQSVAVADVNGDSKPDLMVASQAGVSVLLGNGGGTFATALNFMTGVPLNSIAVADVNNDGKLDLAVADGLNNVSLLLGNGNGTFAGAANFAAGANPHSIAIDDVNGDGKPDLVAANLNVSSNNVSVLLGNGDGTFAAATNFVAGLAPQAVAIADVSGDGKLDLVVANALSSGVSVLLGNGNGTFAAALNFATGVSPDSIAIADVNGDGKLDIAVA